MLSDSLPIQIKCMSHNYKIIGGILKIKMLSPFITSQFLIFFKKRHAELSSKYTLVLISGSCDPTYFASG